MFSLVFSKFIIPIEFIVFDYDLDYRVPIIFGHPFLATGGALTNFRYGIFMMRLYDEYLVFRVFKSLKTTSHIEIYA